MYLVGIHDPQGDFSTSSIMAMSPSAQGNLDTQIQQLRNEYKDVFKDKLPPTLPPDRNVEQVIETGDATPVRRAPFKMSPLELDEYNCKNN